LQICPAQVGCRVGGYADQAQIALREWDANARVIQRLLDGDRNLAVDRGGLVEESASNHARSLKSRELSPKFSKKATGSGSRITFGLAFATSPASQSRAGRVSRTRHPRSDRSPTPVRKVQLVTLSEMSMPLGTMTSAPSNVRITLARMPMCFMVPEVSDNLDRVSHIDRPLEQQDQTRHEVVDDVLQAESDTHAQPSRDNGELRDLDASRRQADQKAKEDHAVSREVRDSVRHASACTYPREHVLLKEHLHPTRQ
jgi:hypothetical protein